MDCVIGGFQDQCLCSVGYLGAMDESNFVDFVPYVLDERDCKTLCSTTQACAVYSYFTSQDDAEPNTCVLLSNSGFKKSVTQCPNCKTGPATCKADQECQAGTLVDANGAPIEHIFAKSDTTITSIITAEKDCYIEVKALMIGGGGKGGGGGSGNVVESVVQLKNNMEVYVGQGGSPSTIGTEDQIVAFAPPGSDNNGNDGGAGYSGGGGYGGGDGGENGSDGQDGNRGNSGGMGSGLDIQTIQMNHFILSPGKAGVTSGTSGGGGDGILVNGEKPDDVDKHHGEGFGGGGASKAGARTD